MISKRHLKRLQKAEKLKNLEKFENAYRREASSYDTEPHLGEIEEDELVIKMEADFVGSEEFLDDNRLQFNVVHKEKEEESCYERLERKIENVRESVVDALKNETEALHRQMKVILETVSEQNVAISGLVRNQTEDGSILTVFPTTNEECLRKKETFENAYRRETSSYDTEPHLGEIEEDELVIKMEADFVGSEEFLDDKRLQFNVVDKEKEEESCYERLERKIENLKDSVVDALKNETEALQKQMKVILEIVSEQNVGISRLVRNQTEDRSIITVFPLTTEEYLRKMDEEIISRGRDGYIKTLKRIFNQGGVAKSLHRILGDEIIASFNIKGIHGKKCLDQFKNFYSVLLDSIPSDNSNDTRENLLRRAIYVNKKRLHKKQYLKRKREESYADDAQHELSK